MEDLADLIRQVGREFAVPSEAGLGVGQTSKPEQAIVDRHKKVVQDDLSELIAQVNTETRQQQRSYAEQAAPEISEPVKEMLSNLGDRGKVLGIMRQMTPEQRQEALRLAPGIAQQLGDDRGGAVARTLGAISRGISHGVSQPLQEMLGLGGTADEIEYIRQLDAAASQEFNPSLPSDPWYQRGPLQVAEMVPWMATVVGGAGLGRAAATGVAGRIATGAAAGSKVAGGLQKAGQVVGKIPTKVPVVGKYLPAMTAGKAGELAGITAAGFPPLYAQEVDQLKAIGMEDGTQLRLLAGGTAAITGLIEGIVPNPFGGKVPFTEGAVKAARKYLWEAAKRAPGEMSEEYLQGVTSGLGQHVAQYLDENAEDKTVADAFRKGWEQTKEAALPMAFLLGVPAVGGAGLAAARATNVQPPGPPPVADPYGPPPTPLSDEEKWGPPPGWQAVPTTVVPPAVIPTAPAIQDPQQLLARLQGIVEPKGYVSKPEFDQLVNEGIIVDDGKDAKNRGYRWDKVNAKIGELQQQAGVTPPVATTAPPVVAPNAQDPFAEQDKADIQQIQDPFGSGAQQPQQEGDPYASQVPTNEGTTDNGASIPSEYDSLFNSDGNPLGWRFTRTFAEANGLGHLGVSELQKSVMNGSPITIEQAKALEEASVSQQRADYEAWKEQQNKENEEAKSNPRQKETRTRKNYLVRTEDDGEIDAFILRSSDGSAAIFFGDWQPIDYKAAYAKDKSDEELLSHSLELRGYQGAKQQPQGATDASQVPTNEEVQGQGQARVQGEQEARGGGEQDPFGAGQESQKSAVQEVPVEPVSQEDPYADTPVTSAPQQTEATTAPSVPPAETTQASADQVNVDSGEESKLKTEDADLEAMIDAEFDAQLGTEKKPAQKSTGKKKSPSAKPKTRIRKAADNARQEADDLWAELNKQSKEKLMTGLDPDLAKLAVRVALAEIKAKTLTFAAFVEKTVAKVPAEMLDKLKPYMEMAWKVAHKRGMTDDPAGKFDDVLAKSDYGTLEAPNRVELGKHFQQQLESGKDYKSIVEARKEAATLIAGEDANIEPGTPAAKAIDEAVEQGVVRAARSIAESSSDPLEVYDSLLDLYERQPRLNVRTGTSMRQQAYSTPAPAAWIANILSDTSRDNTAYDSSAGNGMLLLGVDTENAIANELNPERAQALRELGYQVHEGDATKYTPERQPDRIIINPPFGELEGQSWSVGGTTTDKIDHAIVLKTLESLPEDGKAVLIIGSKGFEQRQPKDELRRGEAYKNEKNFYNALYDGYNVTDHFTLHGDMYSKQGAAFPIDVIVIDGRGKSALPKPYQIDRQNAIPRVINSWKELRDVGERYLDTGTGRPSDLSTEPVADDLGNLSSLLEGQGKGTGKGGRGSGKNTGGGGSVPPRGNAGNKQPRGDSGQPNVSSDPDGQGQPDAKSIPDEGKPSGTGRRSGDAKGLDRPSPELEGDAETEFQVAYKKRSGVDGVGTLVPRTQARAIEEALEKAEDRYGNLDELVAKELGYKQDELQKYFSGEQVDALALAIARHKEGKAFVLGDQTGVGKGRVAAGMMVYAKRQGLVPVFMTQSPDLYADMYRDLQDIGQHSGNEPFYALATNTLVGEKGTIQLPGGIELSQTADFAKNTLNAMADSVVNGNGPVVMITVEKTTDENGKPLGKTPSGKDRVRKVQEQRDYDAVFTTYSQMQTVGGSLKERHTALSRMAQNTFFVLDESHNAGGGATTDADAHGQGTTRAALIRAMLDEAKGILFLSATYAKRPDVMDLYARTGMADSIEGAEEGLIDTIQAGGLPLQQVLSEMLSEAGAYMRRERSFDGIDFDAKVEETGIEEAGQIADIFGAIDRLDRIKNEIVKSKSFQRWLTSQGLGLGKDSATGRRGMESSTFSSIVHNLVNQMLLSLKADATADAAIASIERGEAPVIALSNTMGSALDQYLEANPANVGDEIDFRFSRVGERYLERSREIMLTDVDSTGKRTSRRVRLPDEVLGEDGIAAYDEAKALIDGFAADIPASPIDHIRNRIEQAGYTIREVTGRDLIVDYSEGKIRLGQRPKNEIGSAGKLATVKAYNNGELDAMLLNPSGATGLSAHASKKNPPAGQKRRHMIIAQADANIDTFMQMLGRINRTGQVTELEGQPKNSNLPHYTLLMTNVPAEIRPAAVLIKKLSSLNANVTADSKGSVSFDAPDILNKVGDRVVAEYIADNPALNHALGDIVEVNGEGAARVVPDIARKVSGRMAMRPIPEQQAFWDSVTETYAEEIEQLNKLGKNPLAATRLDLGARTLERVEIFSGDTTDDSPFLQPAYADRVRVKKQGEPLTPDEIKSEIYKFYGIRQKRKRGPDPFGDMASELHREAITGEVAEQNVTVSTPDLRKAISEWSDKQEAIAIAAVRAKAEQQVARLVNEEAIERVWSRVATVQSTIRRRLNSVAPGMAVAVAEVQEEGRYSGSINGIVIDVKVKKGKEHLPSGWIATIALSSPDRVLRVPFSRIEDSGTMQPGDVYVGPMFEMANDRMYAEWEEIGDVYEERIIGTGNVLAAFDKLVSPESRGNIVFFTNEEGVSQRGVLMPRSFNLDRWAADRPITFTTPQQVLDFLNISAGHQVNDPNFAIQFILGGATGGPGSLLVRSPRSRQRSGKYTTNQELIEASGTDFVSVGQVLQMIVRGKKQQLAVIEATLKLGPLIAANFKEDARNITNVPSVPTDAKQPPNKGSGTTARNSAGDESRSLDAFTSPELQNRQSMGAAKRVIASAADLVGDDDGGPNSQYASQDDEFERRWQQATKGIGKKSLATRLREFWNELVKSTVRGSLPELPRTEQFGEARSAMHAYQNAPVYAQLATADLLKKTSKPLSASDYDLFTRVVIMRDQVEAADKGERLSYGLTPAKAKAELDRVEALAEGNERVQASLEYRKQWTEAMVDDFIAAHEYLGLDMSDKFKRENYFRHQVLYYMEAQQRGLGKKKVELTPNRSWLKGRTSGGDLGEAFDINANYLQAEWEVSTQMIADTKRAQAIGRLKRHYDKMRQLKAEAKHNNYVAVVGGQENMDEIEELRGLMEELRSQGSLDSGEKAQMKEWSERLWELDPTMPFRRDMAIARDQIERGADSLGEEVPDDFMRYVTSLSKQDDSPLQGPALAFLKAISDRKAFIKNALGDEYQTWEDVVPDDHEEVAIRPGRAMFQAYSVPEQVASELMADLSKTLGISAEDLRPLTALGAKYTPLVVPQEVAAQMAEIDSKMDFGWLDRIVTRPMSAWKRWVLMAPTRVLKYNLRNLSEIDKVMALNPAAIKDIPQAIRDLWKLYSGADDIPASVRDWVERGGSGTLVRVNELGELNELKEFARLIADKKSGVVGKVIQAPATAWRKYWSAVGMGSDFRESILRYAAYLNYVKQLESGKLTNYGGSVRAEVDGIKDNKDKAMRLSSDLLGDYGDISIVGQFMRSRIAPFWSFQETNVRTYFRGLINLASNEQSAIKAGMQIARAAGIGGLAKAPFLAYKLGRIAILFYGLKAMTTAFNQFLFGDDDDELPEEEKRKAHLTFGKNAKGEVQYFSRIGTAADVLDWVGLDSVDYDLRDVLDGRRTIRDVLSDMARSPVDKAYGMLSPFMKVPTELAVGQTAYPSVGKPRPIRDRGRYIAQNLGIQKEYDKLAGNPSTPYSVTDLLLYKVEPGTAAYYLTLDAKSRWLKTDRNRGVGYSDSVRGNALRSYKMALRLNDQVAVDKYLAEYEAAGGTKKGMLDSLESSHPAGGLSTIDAFLFYKSLAPVEQDEYRKAEMFYYSELLTEEQAKEIRARRDKRIKDLALGKNKDGTPKGKPEKQDDETWDKYRERKRTWDEERKIAKEAWNLRNFSRTSE